MMSSRWSLPAGVLLAVLGVVALVTAAFIVVPAAPEADRAMRSDVLGISALSREAAMAAGLLGWLLVLAGVAFLMDWLRRGLPARLYRLLLLAVGLATAAALLALHGLSAYLGMLMNGVAPPHYFHEGEWLMYGAGSPNSAHGDLFIHGYLINVLPSALAGLAGDTGIAFGRVYRIILGAGSFLVILGLLVLLARRLVAQEAKRPWFVALGLALLFLGDGFLFSIGSRKYWILHAPVRDLAPLLLMFAILLVAPTRYRRLGLGAAAVRAAIAGVVITLAVLTNILAPVYLAGFAGLYLLHVLVGEMADRLRLLLTVAVVAGLSAALTGVALSMADSRTIAGTFGSLSYFMKNGHDNFPDQVGWYTVGGLSKARVFLTSAPSMQAALIAGACALALLVLQGRSVPALLRSGHGLVLACIAWVVASNVVLVTGVATTSTGLGLLVIVYGAWLATRAVEGVDLTKFLAGFEPKASNLLLSGALVLGAFAIGSQAITQAQAAKTVMSAKDRDIIGAELHDHVTGAAKNGGYACAFSLMSESLLLRVSGLPRCTSVPLPIYAAATAEQRRMVEELSNAGPVLMHVASAAIDHHYPPRFQVPQVHDHVLANYRPAALVAGKWFWQRQDGAGRVLASDTAAERTVPMAWAATGDILATSLSIPTGGDWPFPTRDVGDPHVGLVVLKDGVPVAVAVGTADASGLRATLPIRSAEVEGGAISLLAYPAKGTPVLLRPGAP